MPIEPARSIDVVILTHVEPANELSDTILEVHEAKCPGFSLLLSVAP